MSSDPFESLPISLQLEGVVKQRIDHSLRRRKRIKETQ